MNEKSTRYHYNPETKQSMAGAEEDVQLNPR